MLGVAMYTTIKTLNELGKNKSEIARLVGHDWKTVQKVVKNIEEGKDFPDKKDRLSQAEPYKYKIIQLLEEGLTGIRIHEELAREGFIHSYSCIKKYVRKLKRKENIFVRIHTAPGQEVQVDFGYVGLTPDNTGKRRRTWVFNMRLSYSRLDYYEKVYDQRVETFIQCHTNAFKYFCGIPEIVRIDNLKAAILEANFYEPVYQEMYKTFADHYGFKIIPCRVRKPNDKGKVESGIKYVKNNFFLGRKFKNSDDLERQLLNWLNNKCNQRLHGTTRKIPREVFELEEKNKLKNLPLNEFNMSTVGTRKVYHDCHIYVEYNYYSVPFEYVGCEVDIELNDKLLKIFYKGKEIAVHSKQNGRGSFSTNDSHYPKYKKISNTEYQEKYQAKMAKIGPYAEQMFFSVMQHHQTDWTRTIYGILSLVEIYNKEIVELACKRALAYNATSYQIIKNICINGAYNMPVEFTNIEEGIHEHA